MVRRRHKYGHHKQHTTAHLIYPPRRFSLPSLLSPSIIKLSYMRLTLSGIYARHDTGGMPPYEGLKPSPDKGGDHLPITQAPMPADEVKVNHSFID